MFDGVPVPGHLTPGAALDAMLATDPGGLDADGCLEEVIALEKVVARAQAAQLRRTARLAALRPADGDHVYGDFTTEELACALSVTGQAARARLDLAVTLARRLPLTLGAMQRGDVDLRKARTLGRGDRAAVGPRRRRGGGAGAGKGRGAGRPAAAGVRPPRRAGHRPRGRGQAARAPHGRPPGRGLPA